MKRRFGTLAALLLSASPALASYGSGTQYDQNSGDITNSPVAINLSGITFGRGIVTITGGSGNDVSSVTYSYRSVVVKRGNYTETYTATDVSKIIFYGNDGDDQFTNSTSIPCEAYGNDGNDVLYGGSGDDFLVGGLGQDVLKGEGGSDTIWGSGGSDWLYGGEGADLIKGHGGNDLMYGENGSDAMYGGTGDDNLSGGAYQDTLVTIGGGFDTVAGGTSNDLLWVDTTDNVTDASAAETSGLYVNKVAAFFSVSYDGGSSSTPVAKDLTNFDLPDPIPVDFNVDLQNYADRPLFSSLGPTKDDVLQGSGNDCYMLGPLAAVADATPDSIKKLVVDLDDGTYAVRFWRTAGASPEYVRVDADLWVDDTSLLLEYAKLGVEDALWVPIVEKAWALFRQQDGMYSSISGGNSPGSAVTGLGADNSESYTIDPVYDATAIINWVNQGKPAGAINNYINTMVPGLLQWIADRQGEVHPIYTGYVAGSSDTTAFDVDHWRRGIHVIMVDHVNFDAFGKPVSVTLRDQIGPYTPTFTDWTHIYFMLGRAMVYDMP
jgi:hypothetical protein